VKVQILYGGLVSFPELRVQLPSNRGERGTLEVRDLPSTPTLRRPQRRHVHQPGHQTLAEGMQQHLGLAHRHGSPNRRSSGWIV